MFNTSWTMELFTLKRHEPGCWGLSPPPFFFLSYWVYDLRQVIWLPWTSEPSGRRVKITPPGKPSRDITQGWGGLRMDRGERHWVSVVALRPHILAETIVLHTDPPLFSASHSPSPLKHTHWSHGRASPKTYTKSWSK